jgi:hypothetical protein
MKLPALLLGVLAFSGLWTDAAAQCCTAGNPVNTNCALTADGAHMLTISWSYMYAESDAYYRGTQRLDKSYAESNIDYSSLALSYAVSDKLRLTADLGYYLDKSQRFVQSDYTRYARGISDATLGIGYTAYATDDRLFEFVQTARVTIPVGSFDQEYDGVVLPIDFQPSSGNYRYSLGVILGKRFVDSDFSLLSSASVEFSQAIETRNTYHKYGNLYLASLMGIYRIAPSLQAMLQLRGEMRDRALNGTIGPGSTATNQLSFLNSSGGVIAYLAPQVAVSLFNGWLLSFQYNYPVYRNIYGEEQLTNRHSVSLGLSRVIDFGGSGGAALPYGGESPSGDGEPMSGDGEPMSGDGEPMSGDGEPMSEDGEPMSGDGEPMSGDGEPMSGDGEVLHRATVHVRGNCDMCKDRIEATAGSVTHVRAARWEAETETLTLYYGDSRPDIDGVEKALAEAGHDTDTYTAPDVIYDTLPGCCQYR